MNKKLYKLKNIKRRGQCGKCKHWYVLVKIKGDYYLPKHKENKRDTVCFGSGYSWDGFECLVTTPDEATLVAKFIQEDDGKECFGNIGNSHSADCGDGDNCNSTRLVWAKALAEYVLMQQKIAKAKEAVPV